MEKILRTDAELALDDVTESCKAAADHYRSAAPLAPPPLAEEFGELGRRHGEWGRRLEEEVRRMGNLPSAPDADREAVDHFLTRVKAALSRDERAALLERAAEVEAEVAARAEAALREEVPPSARELLRAIAEGAGSTRERLSAAARR